MDKKTFTHALKNLSLAIGRYETNINVAENALHQAKENRDYALEILDELNREIAPYLP